MKVMYIHSVPQFGGASRSLFELVRALKELGVEPFFVASHGSVEPYFGSLSDECVYSKRIVSFNNTTTGYYRKLRWLVPLREIASLPRTFLAFRSARRKFNKVDIIHANEVIDLPSALIASIYFDAPIVIHLRTSFRNKRYSLRSKVILWALRRFVSRIIAIDENTRSTLPECLDVSIVHNSLHINASHLLPIKEDDSGVEEPIRVGYVGNILHNKGIVPLLQATKLVLDRGRSIRLVVVGGGIIESKSYRAKIIRFLGLSDDATEAVASLIQAEGLGDVVEMKGHVDDIGSVFSSMDVLAFLSVCGSPGRPIFEAALFGIPSIAYIPNPKNDTFIENETGLSVAAREPESIAGAIEYFCDSRDELRRMGKNARNLAVRNFEPQKNAELVWNIYLDLRRVIEEKRKS